MICAGNRFGRRAFQCQSGLPSTVIKEANEQSIGCLLICALQAGLNFFGGLYLCCILIQNKLILYKMASRNLVPTFIMKTYEMLEDQSISEIVSWTEQGLSFVVKNQQQLQQKVLPHYFKHRNYSSFLRQLNLYNFKKSKHQDGQEFKHKCFRQGVKQMLQFIKRRNNEEGSTEIANPNQPSAKLKEEQQILKGCASDIRETNQRLADDMQILQQKSGVLLEEMWNLNKLLHSQFDQVNHKLERIDIIIGAMSQHKKFKNISQYFTPKFLKNELNTLETNLDQPLFGSPEHNLDDQEQIKALFEELQNLNKPLQFE